MSLSDVVAFFRLLVLVSAAVLVAGCSFQPVYGTGAPAGDIALRYAAPDSRLEQIVYQHLELRLGEATVPGAPELSVAVGTSSRRVGLSSSESPSTLYEMMATATATVREETSDVELFSVTRSAAASYTTNGQALADRQAQSEARERATRAVAEQVRLAILAQYRTMTARR